MLHDVIGAEFREVADRTQDGKPAKAVVAARTYDTDAADLWDALTNPERIPRWFSPVTGDLKLGGRYQIQGNAGGTIRRCDPPAALDLTWEFGGGKSWVTLRLAAEGARTRLTLEHMMLAEDMQGEHWLQFGPGAVGVGWDMTLFGLDNHLGGGGGVDPSNAMAWLVSPDGRAFVRYSSDDWARASVADGADPEAARGAADRTTTAYTGG